MENDLFIKEWKELIESSAINFKSINEELASLKRSPDKWSKKQVLGHLCDSAINNYMRIMNLMITNGNCILQAYAQNEWVINGAYQNRKWNSIIYLWTTLNYSFISLVENAPKESWHLFGTYKGDPQSFEFLVTDYVEHMKHHFNQIIADN